KLKLNGGDIKAVQGDSGHAQATMVTDQYSHILDESRRNNAQLFEQAFYGGKGVKIVPEAQDKAVEEQVQQAGLNSEVLLKIFSNPDMVAMLKMLAKTLG
ncbi:MAG: site-specific integrase, partial [Christensenellales bacterium]